MTSPSENSLADFIQGRAQTSNISCKSFIVTVFGDLVSVHGGWIWLGSLIQLLQPLGFSERLVRTSVYRLVQDNWLLVKRKGRKSYYGFSPMANRHYANAARRIYAPSMKVLDERWLIVLANRVEEGKMPEFKRQLSWLGFTNLSPQVFVHPFIKRHDLQLLIESLDLSDSVVVFTSTTLDDSSILALKKILHDKCGIDDLSRSYQGFSADYGAIVPLITQCNQQLELGHSGLLLRLLAVHEYRRILLRDHELPLSVLSEQWPGISANQTMQNLYRLLAESSGNTISQALENQQGALPEAEPAFRQRFL